MKSAKLWLFAVLVTACTVLCIYLLSPGKNPGNLISSTLPEKERTNAPAARALHDFKMMRDPFLNRVPTERLIPARDYMESLQQAPENARTASLSWQERGPNNVGGRSRALLVDRSDLTGNTVFAAGVGGGLWKTTNFKTSCTWTVIDDFFSNIAITCIKQSPTNASEMYFGTGEGWGNYDAIDGLGIWKTTNGGTTWTQLGSTADISYVNDLEFDNNGYLYAATRSANTVKRGIIRSTDGGANWTQVLVDPNISITTRGAELERAADGDMYATLGIFSLGHVFRSAANGTSTGIAGSWSEITPPGITSSSYQRTELAVCASQPNRIYAIAQDDATFGVGAMYRSDDDGANWTTLANASWCDQGAGTNFDFSRTQAWYDLIMAVDPNNSSLVMAGGVVVVKSTNAGSAWTQMTRWTSTASCTSAPVIHADIHEILFLNSSEIIITTDGGIYYSTDGGASFVDKNTGFNVTQYYGLDIHPTTGSNTMIGGTQDNGSHLFSTAGMNSVSSVTGGDGGSSFIDQTNGTVWMTSNPGGYFNIYRSSGTYLGTAGTGSGRFVSVGDYADILNILYFGDDDGWYGQVFNVESGTATVNIVSNLSTEMGANRQVSCIKVDPADETTIWLGCSDSENNTGAPVTPRLLKVSNADGTAGGGPGAPSALVFTGPALAAGSYLSSIDIEPGNSNHMLLTVSNYGVNSIWESTDGGTNWTSIEGNLPDMPVRSAFFIPSGYTARSSAIGGILIATELGVWSTTNVNGGSTNWVPNNNGLANVRVDQVVYRSSDRLVAAGTHGRGVYTSTLLNAPLPVTLVSFTGEIRQDRALLKWTTSSEINSKHFELERSRNGNDFERIAIIPAAGSSNSERNYQYTDPERLSEKNYYRLRSVDLDDAFKLSQVVLLELRNQPQDLVILGNPFRESLRLRFFRVPRATGEARLYDMAGHLLMKRTIAVGEQQLEMNLPSRGIPSGSYTLQVDLEGMRFSRIVQKQ